MYDSTSKAAWAGMDWQADKLELAFQPSNDRMSVVLVLSSKSTWWM
jgi:hypothetical protein